jgi:hypothetical protein
MRVRHESSLNDRHAVATAWAASSEIRREDANGSLIRASAHATP